MYEYKRISPVIFVLEDNGDKYYFATKMNAKIKWISLGNKAYTAPIKCFRFESKQELLDFVTGQNHGDTNDNQSTNRNNL